jgi:prepilin-type N-terminal cleavage/methylation domain
MRYNQNTNHIKTEYSSGFSLLEILVSLLLISILITLGSINLYPIYKKYELKRSVEELEKSFENFRFLSILKGIKYQVYSSNNEIYFEEYKKNSPNLLKSKVSFPKDSKVEFSGKSTISPSGFITPSKSIYITKNNWKIKVTININGRIRYEFK